MASRGLISEVAIDRIAPGMNRRPLGDLTWLMDSIQQNGLLNPITVSSELRLIAGRHRLEACRCLGHTTILANIIGATGLDLELASIDENLIRNELILLERSEHYYERKQIYEALHPETRNGGDRGNQFTGGKRRQSAFVAFSLDAQQKTGKAQRTIQQYLYIARRLQPEAKELIRKTHVAHSHLELLRLARLDGDQIAVARKLSNGEARTVKEARLLAEREARLAQECSALKHTAQYLLLRGNFEDVGSQIETASVELIVTDPPYLREHLHIFEPLARLGARVLKPGCSMFVMVSPYHLPEILAKLRKYLHYNWMLVLLLAGNASLIQSRRVSVGYKPILWLTNGSYRGRSVRDVIQSNGRDKRFHRWGQAEGGFDQIIARFSGPGQTVLDPFVGGGTTAAVALRLRRRFIGIDADEAAIEVTRRRIAPITAQQVSLSHSRV